MSCQRHKRSNIVLPETVGDIFLKQNHCFLLDSIKIKILENMVTVRIVMTKTTTKVVTVMMNWTMMKRMTRTLHKVVTVKSTKVQCCDIH